MRAWIAVAFLLLPAAGRAQSGNPLARPIERAKEAAKTAGEPRKEVQEVERQLAEPPPDTTEPGTIDLGEAAEKLEGQAPEEAAPAAEEAGAVQPPETYVVKPGDTLWDLSGRFLNNPWYWPKVWSYNPEITNPHWIYPGNVVRFFPAAEEAPTRVEPVAEAPPEPVEAPRELEDLSRGSISGPSPLADTDAVAVVGPYKIGGGIPTRATVRHETFVTDRELEESGVISAAFEEKEMLATTDKIYARFRKNTPVKVGETYVVYRTEGKVRHPVTGRNVGYKTRIIGGARVVALGDRVATLTIVAAFDPISRGDYLGPWSQKIVRRVAPKPNQASLDGYILAAETSWVTEIGEHHVVYVDKGRADGVEEGNTFEVLRSGDPWRKDPFRPTRDRALPDEVIGRLLVVDAKEHASTALVSRSFRELFAGDRVQMRPAGAAPGSGGF